MTESAPIQPRAPLSRPLAVRGTLAASRLPKCRTFTAVELDALPHRIFRLALNFARGFVPSGASTGIYEALELKDRGCDYLGKGVLKLSTSSHGKEKTGAFDVCIFKDGQTREHPLLASILCVKKIFSCCNKAVSNGNDIIGPALVGKDPTEQTDIDNFMVQQLQRVGLVQTEAHWESCREQDPYLE